MARRSFRAHNPWVSIGPEGVAYIVSNGNPWFDQSAVYVNRSLDGGLTWSDPTLLQLETNDTMNDKATITADPYDPDYAYAVWKRNAFPNEDAAPAAAAQNTAASRGPAWFSRTTNGGRTWEPGHQIYDPGEENGTLGHQIVVLGGARFAVSCSTSLSSSSDTRMHRGAAASTSRRFFPATGVLPGRRRRSLRTRARCRPLIHSPVRASDREHMCPMSPSIGQSGALYAVWMDARFSDGEYNDIAVSMSIDAGVTWSKPVRANRTPPLPST